MVKPEFTFILFLGFIALSSWWFSKAIEKQATLPKAIEKTHIPLYYSRNIELINMSKTGQLKTKLTAERMIHFLDDETTDLKNPHYIAYNTKTKPLVIQSSKGWISKDSQHIILKGTVYIDRKADSLHRPLHLITRNLHLFPKQNKAKTKQDVIASSGKDWINAIGMEVLFTQSNQIKLLSRVRGHYENTH